MVSLLPILLVPTFTKVRNCRCVKSLRALLFALLFKPHYKHVPTTSVFVQFVAAQGPACSSCYAAVNIAQASEFGQIITGCLSLFPRLSTEPTSTAIVGSTICSSQCSPINIASSSCTNDACFCSIVRQYASACSQCWATIDILEANVFSTILHGCQTELHPTGSSGGVPGTMTAMTATSLGTPSSTSPSSGASRFSRKICADDTLTCMIGVSLLLGLVGLLL